MSDPKVVAAGMIELITGEKQYKADVAGEMIDQLIGTDANAVVHNIKGLPAEMVELISDQIVGAIKAAIIAKMGA